MTVANTTPQLTTAREVALSVVRDVFGPELRGAQAAFDVRVKRARLDARDRAFAAELAYGSIKQRRLLDFYLEPYVGDRPKPLTPVVAEILRLGVYQLRFMSGVEDHAAVSETVNLTWRHGHKGTAGLVNAVLRRMIENGPRSLDEGGKSEIDRIAIAYSLPTWIATRFGAALGERRDAALAGINVRPRAAIRVNTLRSEVALVREELTANGIDVVPSELVPEVLLLGGGAAHDDPNGRFTLQGESAAIAVDLLAPQPGEQILELCSGRGNKSVQIAARMAGEGTLTCVERDQKKIPPLREALALAGVTNAAIVAGDAATAAADVRAAGVLLDAPCSGLGILGRHPEARWRKTPEDGARLAETQASLLRAAAERTAVGGRLVYSVCSIDSVEGRAVVDAFLASDPAFSRAAIPSRYEPFVTPEGDLLIAPGIEGRDGFYVASLARAS